MTTNKYLEKIADSIYFFQNPEDRRIHKELQKSHDVSLGTTLGTLAGNVGGKFLRSRRGQIAALLGGAATGAVGGGLYNAFVRQKQRGT